MSSLGREAHSSPAKTRIFFCGWSCSRSTMEILLASPVTRMPFRLKSFTKSAFLRTMVLQGPFSTICVGPFGIVVWLFHCLFDFDLYSIECNGL